MKRISGLRDEEEVMVIQVKLCHDELHNLYSSPNSITVIKLRRNRLTCDM
jgi:hypothetical protein